MHLERYYNNINYIDLFHFDIPVTNESLATKIPRPKNNTALVNWWEGQLVDSTAPINKMIINYEQNFVPILDDCPHLVRGSLGSGSSDLLHCVGDTARERGGSR